MSAPMESMLVFLLFLFLQPSLLHADICQQCPDGWVKFRESCYLFADEFTSDWTEATHYCASHLGAHLVVIDSEPEEMMLRSYTNRLFKSAHADRYNSFWIGATDDEIEGLWVWYTDHQPVSSGYQNWAPGQPQNGSPTDQDCGCLWGPSKFRWEDCACSEKTFHAICERNMTSGSTQEIVG